MIVVNAIIKTNETNIAAMKSAVQTMETASRAEQGCHDYTFSVELNNPDVLRITECWEDMAALGAHFKTDHMATFQAALAQNPVEVTANFYEAAEVPPPAR